MWCPVSFHHHDQFLEQLLPVIEKNIRENEMLEPVMILQDGNGSQIVFAMGMFFNSGMAGKDAIVPMIDTLFATGERLHMVALISEAWMAKVKTKDPESIKGPVQDMPGKIDAVLVTIYSRDRRDKMFCLEIKPGRTGVEKSAGHTTATGRLSRDKPSDN